MSRDLRQLSSGDILRQLEQAGEISIPQLRQIQRAEQHQNRVYERPHETVYETTHTTIEIYDFE
jgi:hypothetical protein